MSAFADIAAFDAALATLPATDESAIAAARARQSMLTKPPGSLGRLEQIAAFFAGWQRRGMPRLERVRTAVFAGNHGIAAHGVSAFPPEVTAQMVANFAAGGAAINALARVAGAELRVVALDLDRPTADFTTGPAMSASECLTALSAGAAVVDDDLDLLLVGEMGIGNTTSAAALCLRSLGGEAGDWVGSGTGIGAEAIGRKIDVVARGVQFHAEAPHTPFETLCRLGGREIAAIAGAVLAARHRSIPVLLDGFITCAAIAPLAAAVPNITAHCLAAHCSAEAGHARLLARLALDPLLRLDMRLGEASGAAVAVGIIRAALAAHREMRTFEEAAVAKAV